MRRGRRLLIGLAVLVAVIGLGIVIAVQMVAVARDLEEARDLIEDASVALTEGRLQDALTGLQEAEGLVIDASHTLHTSPAIGLIRWMPIVNTNLHGISAALDTAGTTIHGGRQILAVSGPLQGPDGKLEVSLSEGEVPLQAISEARHHISGLLDQLITLQPPSRSRWILPPVDLLAEEVFDEAVERRMQLRVLDRGLNLLEHLVGADGERRYLIAVANSAEMRGTGGMILNYGILEGNGGKVELTDFGRVDELGPIRELPPDTVPADYLQRWSGFDPLSRVRQANLGGDFTVVAPVLEEMYTTATGFPVHGVIQVDPVGLAAILEGVGPVTVPEVGEVTADNVVALTLNQAYFDFPDVETRSDVLGDVAEAAFRRLVEGEFESIRTLAEALARAVDARHLMMHAVSPPTQNHLAALGADGAYPEVTETDSVAFTAQNLAGNKLDYYLDTDIELVGTRTVDEPGEMTAQITLTNTAPPLDAPLYIFGPGPGNRLPAGTIRSLVTLYLPFGTSLVDASGDRTVEPATSGTEAGRPYASFTVDVPAGESRTVVLDLALAARPSGPYELLLMPTPRVRPTTASVELRTDDGEVTGLVALDRTWRLAPDADPEHVLAPAYRDSARGGGLG